MSIQAQIMLGTLAVIVASVLIVCRPARIFGRALSVSEAISVCWVAYAIFIGAMALYYAVKLPLGLSRTGNAPATALAVCVSMAVIVYLGSVHADWNSMVTRSLLALLILLWIIGAVYVVW
jgi:hypothetical protein